MTDLQVVPSLGAGVGAGDADVSKASDAQRRARSARMNQKAEGSAAGTKRKAQPAAGSGAKGKTQTNRTAAEDEKERKRMKRLLRNRVSAQQARERKKAYLANLEQQTKIQQLRTAQLEDRNKTLEMEVMTLRALLKTYMGAGNGPGQGKSFDEVVSQVTQIVSDKMVEWQNQQRMMAMPHGGGGMVYHGMGPGVGDEDDDDDDDDEDDDEEEDDEDY